MTDQRIILEMGMGNDLYGMDYTKAAARAIEDALRHSTLPLFETLDIPHSEMRVAVTIGVQERTGALSDRTATVHPCDIAVASSKATSCPSNDRKRT